MSRRNKLKRLNKAYNKLKLHQRQFKNMANLIFILSIGDFDDAYPRYLEVREFGKTAYYFYSPRRKLLWE